MKEILSQLLSKEELEIIPLNFFNARKTPFFDYNESEEIVPKLMESIELGDSKMYAYTFYKIICR